MKGYINPGEYFCDDCKDEGCDLCASVGIDDGNDEVETYLPTEEDVL